MKKALITGITGQDGSYLADLLLKKGYEVHGIVRKKNSSRNKLIEHILKNTKIAGQRFFLHQANLLQSKELHKIVKKVSPDEIYHLGAQSNVDVSFNSPANTADVTALGTIHILDAIMASGIKTKLYQASSSEMFGKPKEVPQNETTALSPSSPYGCAKAYAYWMIRSYRENYGLFTSNGILFNHESPRRGEKYVTRKITLGPCKIKVGLENKILLGNLDAKRDWGYAKDYVEGMWKILQQKDPGEYVLATGQSHSVREFIEEATRLLGISLIWKGKGLQEKGIDKKTNKTIVEIDPRYFRPVDSNMLMGDYKKAKQKLGWHPKTSFKELVKIMVEADLKKVKDQS